MKVKTKTTMVFGLLMTLAIFGLNAQMTKGEKDMLDARVQKYLRENPEIGRGMASKKINAQALYDLIIEKNYKQGLEIGTYLGHGTIYMTWALAKNGGKLIAVEYNEKNYKRTLESINGAGLTEYVDVRLANAHDEVPKLVRAGEKFDIVFSDADKNWYIEYFKNLIPATLVGGSHVADNTYGDWWNSAGYRDYVDSLDGWTTKHFPARSTSISVKN